MVLIQNFKQLWPAAIALWASCHPRPKGFYRQGLRLAGGRTGKPDAYAGRITRYLCVGFPHAVRVFLQSCHVCCREDCKVPDWGLHRWVYSPHATAVRSDQLILAGGPNHCRPGGKHHVCAAQQALFPYRLDHRHEQDPGGRERFRDRT